MMRRFLPLTVLLSAFLLLLAGPVQAQEADTAAADAPVPDTTQTDTLRTDTTGTAPPDTATADTPLPADTAQAAARPDTLVADTLAADSLAADSLAADTTAADPLTAAERRARAKEQAQSVASSWLALTDAGEFGKSWDAAAPSLQNSISREAWVERGTQARSALDSLQSRSLTRTLYRDSTRRLANERPVVALQYRSEFKGRSVLEAVIAAKAGPDWKVAGYRIVPAGRALPDSVRAAADSALQAAPADTVQPDTTQVDTTRAAPADTTQNR
jgi:hypothetical protein